MLLPSLLACMLLALRAQDRVYFVVLRARVFVGCCICLFVLLISCLLFVLGCFLVELLLLFNSIYLLMVWFVLFTISF